MLNLLKKPILTDKSSNVSVEIVTITPKMAAKFLNKNECRQRHLNDLLVARLAKAMSEGNWILNGETLIFDTDTKLLNGQHRLQACILSNSAFTTLVVRGVHNSAFESIDIGRSRRAEDLLKIQGFKSYTLLTSAIRLTLTYSRTNVQARSLDPSGCTPMVDHHDILHFAIDDPEMEKYCNSVNTRFSKTRKLLPQSVASFLYATFSRIDEEKREVFFHCLTEGVPTGDNCRVLAAREKLIDHALLVNSNRGRVANYYKVGLLLDAWNWLLDPETTSKFQKGDTLPVIENDPWR